MKDEFVLLVRKRGMLLRMISFVCIVLRKKERGEAGTFIALHFYCIESFYYFVYACFESGRCHILVLFACRLFLSCFDSFVLGP